MSLRKRGETVLVLMKLFRNISLIEWYLNRDLKEIRKKNMEILKGSML